MGLLTSVAICSTSFLLGVLFTSGLWDSTILFSTAGPVTEGIVAAVEQYYLTWWYGAMPVKVFLHIVYLIAFMSITAKFARYTDTSFFFSGGSLLLLILNTSVYISITLPSIRTIAKDPLDPSAHPIYAATDLFTRIQALFARQNSGPLGDNARATAAALLTADPMTYSERIEHISILSAGNTLAVVLLVGVLIMQVGEWYVEENVVKPEMEIIRAAEAAAAANVAVTEEKKTQ